MIVKLLTEQNLEFLSLKGGCTGLSESIHVKMLHCWKSHVTAQTFFSGSVYGVCLWLGPLWHNYEFSLVRTVCEIKANFFVSAQYVLNILFPCDHGI